MCVCVHNSSSYLLVIERQATWLKLSSAKPKGLVLTKARMTWRCGVTVLGHWRGLSVWNFPIAGLIKDYLSSSSIPESGFFLYHSLTPPLRLSPSPSTYLLSFSPSIPLSLSEPFVPGSPQVRPGIVRRSPAGTSSSAISNQA